MSDPPRAAGRPSRRSSVHVSRASVAADRARLQSTLDQLRIENDALRADVEQLRQQAPPPDPTAGASVVSDEQIQRLVSDIDDNALAALLSNNDQAMLQQLFGMEPSIAIPGGAMASTAAKAFAAVPAPILSAGIEGVGSGLEIDYRLATGEADAQGRVLKKRKVEDKPTEAWMEDWLTARRRRSKHLLSNLQSFTGLNIEAVQQSVEDTTRHAPESGSYISVRGTVEKIGRIGLSFDVFRFSPDFPPRVERVLLDLPTAVRAAVEQDGHLESVLVQSNLPSIFMTLSSLVHGADARRKVFATIGSRVQSVSTDAEVANGDELRLETEALDTSDEQDLRRWYEPTTAETLVLSNGRGAELRFHYRIKFDHFGRGLRTVRLEPWLPPSMRNDQTAEILAPMPEAFAKLAEEKPGIEGVPDIAVLADIVLSFATHFFGAT